jgi:hypothetical protein
MNNLVSGQKDAIHELVEQPEPRESPRAEIIGDGRILELRIGFDRKAENIRRLVRRALQNLKQNPVGHNPDALVGRDTFIPGRPEN